MRREQIEQAAFKLAEIDAMEAIMEEIDHLSGRDPIVALVQAFEDERITDLMQAVGGSIDEAATNLLTDLRIEAARRADGLRQELGLEESAPAARAALAVEQTDNQSAATAASEPAPTHEHWEQDDLPTDVRPAAVEPAAACNPSEVALAG